APLAALHLRQSFSLFKEPQEPKSGEGQRTFGFVWQRGNLALHPDALNHDCRITGKAGKQALQCTGPGAVAPRTKGRLAAAIRQREVSRSARWFIPAGGFVFGAVAAGSAGSSAVCLITMPHSRFSRIIALPEYFRSDTPGSARSCDMYPNRLSL